MGGTADKVQGRIKKATGELTGDDELKREGSVDKASGSAKDAVDKVGDSVKHAVGRDRPN